MTEDSSSTSPPTGLIDPVTNLANLTKSWETAQKHLQLIRPPGRLFTSCIRTLRASPVGQPTQIVLNGPLHVLFRSHNIKSVIYHATQIIHPDKVPVGQPLAGATLIKAITADELCSVVAAMYLYRLIGRDCDPKIWEELAQDLEIQMRAGVKVGQTISSIGTAAGLLVGAIRYLAMSLFSIRDQKAFKVYRRTLRQSESLFDLEYENQTWGCNHLQIASLLLQSLGFGIDASQGVSSPLTLTDKDTEEAWRWYAARRWIESVVITEKFPAEFPPGCKFFPESEAAYSELQAEVDKIYDGDRTAQWIAKTKADLPENIRTALQDIFGKQNGATSQESAVGDVFEE